MKQDISIGKRVIAAGKSKIARSLIQSEFTVRNAVAAHGITRDSGMLNSGLIEANIQYIDGLEAVFDSAIEAEAQYQAKQMQDSISTTGVLQHIEAGKDTEVAQKHSSLAIANIEIQKKASLSGIEITGQAELSEVNAVNGGKIKALSKQGSFDVNVAKQKWDIKTQIDVSNVEFDSRDALSREQVNTKQEVKRIELDNRKAVKQYEVATRAEALIDISTTKLAVAKDESNAHIDAENVRSQARIDGVNIRGAASLSSQAKVSAARLTAMSNEVAADKVNIQTKSNAQIIEVGRRADSKTSVLGVELSARRQANSIAYGSRIDAENLEFNARTVAINNRLNVEQQITQLSINSKHDILQSKLTGRLAVLREELQTSLEIITNETQSNSLLAKELSAARISASSIKGLADIAGNSRELTAESAALNLTLGAERNARQNEAVSDLAGTLAKTQAELDGDLARSNNRLANEKSVITANLDSVTAQIKAEAFSKDLQLDANAKIQNTRILGIAEETLLKHASDAHLKLRDAATSVATDIFKLESERKIIQENQVQWTKHVVYQ